ncbi:MAG: MFS transporter [Pseudomonadales bacterium]|nr:MFS transporter [Pseudomonadales bacterium]
MSSQALSSRNMGRRMVAVAFFVDFVAVGFFFYSYGVFFKAIAAEFGDSRLGVSLGLTATNVVGAIAAPLLGRALDIYPLKRIIAIGCLSMTTGFLLLSQVSSQLQFYIVLGLFIGFGASSMGGLATAKLIANWFNKRRGRALGIAATGISVSGVVMPFVSAALIEAYGWRQGFLFFGAFTGLVVLPIVLTLVVSKPSDVGLEPDGGRLVGNASGAEPPKPVIEDKPILKERNFWVLVMAIGLMFCCQGATLTHMVPRLTDTGIDLKMASLVMSLCAGLGVVGKVTFGFIGDSWAARKAFWLAIGCQVVGQIMMLLAHDNLFIFAPGAMCFGFGMGGMVPLQGALIGRVFGSERFGKAMGYMRPAQLPLQVSGVPLAGWIYDVTGNYQPAFIIFLGVYAMAAVVVYFFREPDVRR